MADIIRRHLTEKEINFIESVLEDHYENASELQRTLEIERMRLAEIGRGTHIMKKKWHGGSVQQENRLDRLKWGRPIKTFCIVYSGNDFFLHLPKLKG